MAEFELDVDPTRWGRGKGEGLSPATEEFLADHLGPRNPQPAPAWDAVEVPPSRASAEQLVALAGAVGEAHVDTSDDARRRRERGHLERRRDVREVEHRVLEALAWHRRERHL